MRFRFACDQDGLGARSSLRKTLLEEEVFNVPSKSILELFSHVISSLIFFILGLAEFLSAAAAKNIEIVQSLSVQAIQQEYAVEIAAIKVIS